MGFDRVKAADVLQRACDDPQGVNRAFNLNLLARINREPGAGLSRVRAVRRMSHFDVPRNAIAGSQH